MWYNGSLNKGSVSWRVEIDSGINSYKVYSSLWYWMSFDGISGGSGRVVNSCLITVSALPMHFSRVLY